MRTDRMSFLDPSLSLETRVADLVSRLTLDEKIALLPTRQEAVPRLEIPEFWIGGEAAHGLVTGDGTTTVFPQSHGLSCTWDRVLLERIGSVVGDEARAYHRLRKGLGGLCLWAPTIDLERDPRWGRTEEAYGEDPELAGALATAYVRGLQGPHPFFLKAAATVKHFFANNHEEGRTRTSSKVPGDLLESYYLKAFELVLKQGRPASVMTAYNAINGVPAMLRPEINEVLRGRWGWDGFVVCDGGALGLLVSDHRAFPTWAEGVAASLKAGIDCFPEDGARLKPAVAEAIQRGLVTEADIDQAVNRTLKARFRLGLFAVPGENPYEDLDRPIIHRTSSQALAYKAAVKAVVLLKNDGILPLPSRDPGSIAILGPLGDRVYRDWYTGTAAVVTTPLQAFVARLGADRVVAADGSDLVAFQAPNGRYIRVASWNDPGLVADGTTFQAGALFRRTDWGWGSQTFQALANGKFVTTDDTKVEASASEVWGWYVRERFTLEAEGQSPWKTWRNQSLGWDNAGRLWVAGSGNPPVSPGEFRVTVVADGVELAVEAARTAQTAVVFVGNHPLLNGKEEIDRPALTLAPEQVRLIRQVARVHSRTVVVVVGSYPIALDGWQHEVSAVVYTTHGGQEAGNALVDVLFGDANPGGRLSMTWYAGDSDLGDITDYDIRARKKTHLYFDGVPLFPFGYGLSYSTFSYRNLHWEAGANEVVVTVTNHGPQDGDEVAQVYQGRTLVAFERVSISAGETREVRFSLPETLWPSGPLAVGSSSLDLRLTLDLQGISS